MTEPIPNEAWRAMPTQHRFLVTGAAGFIGANLCRRLVEHAEEVHAVVKPSTPTWRLDDLRDRLLVHQADMTLAHDLERVVDEVRPTVDRKSVV